MSEAITHQMMMLRPMQAGLGGYARLQGEAGRQLVQINLRGMQEGAMRVFWYAGEGMVREIGRSNANSRGEASLSAEIPLEAAAPRRLMALLITDGGDRPKPLALGLCTAQSAGSLMDARNALLALCDRLARDMEAQAQPAPVEAAGKSPDAKGGAAISEKPCSREIANLPNTAAVEKASIPRQHPNQKKMLKQAASSGSPHNSLPDLPREVFLPAIEARSRPERRRSRREQSPPPSAGSVATLPQSLETEAQGAGIDARPPVQIPSEPALSSSSQCSRHAGLPPANLLPALHWPAPFQPLAAYFDQYQPQRLMNWPGWRFICLPEGSGGLWIGYRQQDGCVRQVAYALPADARPPEGQPFRPARTAEGQSIQLLVLDA